MGCLRGAGSLWSYSGISPRVSLMAQPEGRFSGIVFSGRGFRKLGAVMHKFLIGIASAAFLTAPAALAADLPVKAQPAPEVFSWSGFYIAVAGGWRHNRVDWDYTNPIPASLSPFRNGNDTGSLAFISGAQRQFGFVVLGVESSTDISLGRGFGSTVGSPAGGPCIASATTACQTRLVGAIFTVGGKAGLAWNNFMFY